MLKNPWFTLVIGLMVGLAVGYVVAERQPVPPGKAMRLNAPPAQGQGQGLPEGHPPLDAGEDGSQARFFQQQIAEIQGLMAQNPEDPGLSVAMGDAYFELARATMEPGQWREAADWYEKAMAQGRSNDPNVMTDLAVVQRNLQDFDRSVELLDRAIAVDANHWQAWFNLVIIKNFDLHDHDGAREAFVRLKAIADENPQVPDLSQIEREVMGK
jgi:tetratricopeptide (TPR) repeat protein